MRWTEYATALLMFSAVSMLVVGGRHSRGCGGVYRGKATCFLGEAGVNVLELNLALDDQGASAVSL